MRQSQIHLSSVVFIQNYVATKNTIRTYFLSLHSCRLKYSFCFDVFIELIILEILLISLIDFVVARFKVRLFQVTLWHTELIRFPIGFFRKKTVQNYYHEKFG